MERLTKTYSDGTHGAADNLSCGENSYEYKGLLLEALGKYEDAEEQGLLIQMPCKVGDTIWQIMFKVMKAKKILYGIYEATITKWSLDACNNLMISTVTNDAEKCRNELNASVIGEVIFLTREEAEAKLKELEEL